VILLISGLWDWTSPEQRMIGKRQGHGAAGMIQKNDVVAKGIETR